MSEYTFRNFLRDRRPYVAAYAAFGLLAVAVIQLDLWLQGASLQFANVAYILLLGVVILAAFLAYEWRRQASFFRRLSDIEHLGQTGPGARSDAADGALVGNTWTHARGPVAPGTSAAREAAPTVASLDDMSILETPLTLEQQAFAGAWAALYGRLRTLLAEEQLRSRQRLHFLSQWAHHMKTPVAVIDLELQTFRRDMAGSSAQDASSSDDAVPSAGADAAVAAPQADDAPKDAAAYRDTLTRLLQSIAEENERIKRALQGLLNAVRLDQFASDFRLEPVNLPDLVRQVINDYRRAFITHEVYPKIEPAGPAAGTATVTAAGTAATAAELTVYSDAKWLRLVLEQIISNAVKYAAPAARAADVERHAGDEHNHRKGRPARAEQDRRTGQVVVRFARENGRAVLEIEDNGIGIPPEDLGRVFDPFFTGSAGRSHAASTGLGLYLAREACRRLGHQLTIRSAPGAGTTVRIRFDDDTSIFAGVRDAVAAPE